MGVTFLGNSILVEATMEKFNTVWK